MTVNEGVFAQCASLQSVTVGNDVTLGNFAFNMDKDENFTVVSYKEGDTKYFYYDFSSALKELTIGNNAVIGENAFAYHAALEQVNLGENAKIGKQAFYSCTSLADIDLSKAAEIGDYAFSGDEYYICTDENMSYAAVSSEGEYMTTNHATALVKADLSGAASIGEYAFAMCSALEEVILNENITNIPKYAFASCENLTTIDLSKVQTVGEYAFMETAKLESVDLSAATKLDKYAFVNGAALASVTLKLEGTDLEEGAFAYCRMLTDVQNLAAVKHIGDYALAYSALTEVDLTGAENVGKQAFMKEEMGQMKVTLGENLKTLGDNPFAMNIVEPFCLVETADFNGTVTENRIYTYDISDSVKIIDGSLYCNAENGLQLITYAGVDPADVQVAEGTARITAMAFAGSDVQMVTMPSTVYAIGHKAFYGCDQLEIVVFGSHESPIMEEEFDPRYYEVLEHIPGTGDFGTYTDYDGQEVQINGMGLVPYFMWNATDGMYFDVYYGCNFKDYVGYVEDKILMVKPVNGVQYDSFILDQYFDVVIDGAQAPSKHTLKTIKAIRDIPEKVSYEQRALVEYARSLYSQIGTLEQQSLVVNFADLISAEQRIIALAPTEENETPAVPEEEDKEEKSNAMFWIVVALLGAVALVALVVVVQQISKKKKLQQVIDTEGQIVAEPAEEPAEEVQEVAEEAPVIAEEEAAEEASETEENDQ